LLEIFWRRVSEVNPTRKKVATQYPTYDGQVVERTPLA
jgi:pyruvate formate-lyase activating enzyme-like uncharacterized protein